MAHDAADDLWGRGSQEPEIVVDLVHKLTHLPDAAWESVASAFERETSKDGHVADAFALCLGAGLRPTTTRDVACALPAGLTEPVRARIATAAADLAVCRLVGVRRSDPLATVPATRSICHATAKTERPRPAHPWSSTMTTPTLDAPTWTRLKQEREAFVDQLAAEQLDRDESNATSPILDGPEQVPNLDGDEAEQMVGDFGAVGALGAVRSGYVRAASARAAHAALRDLGWTPDAAGSAWWPTPFIIATDSGDTWLANAHERHHLAARQVAELVLLHTRTEATDDHPLLHCLDDILRPHATAGAFADVLAEVEPLVVPYVTGGDLPGRATAEWRQLLDETAAAVERRLLRPTTAASGQQPPVSAWPSPEAVRRALRDLRPVLDALPKAFTDGRMPNEELDPDYRWHVTVAALLLAAADSDWQDADAYDLDRLLDWYAGVLAHRFGAPAPQPLPDDLRRLLDLALTIDDPAPLGETAQAQLTIAASGGDLPRNLEL